MSTVLASREEGALLLVRLRIESRQLEDLLETLADLPFPVNPELCHAGLVSVVEFPAFETRLALVREAVAPFDLPVETRPMLEAIRN
ncbi:MAG TPA: hypothetical protein VFQ91_09215 [Bryobacteraceae bacterium]|nr:hypothetical protein [Bryobacteraceae bacterium]